MSRATAGFIDTRLTGAPGSPGATPEQLDEARHAFEALKVELERLLNNRSAFHDELKRAVANGEQMISALQS
jgi:hypothetical protein